MLQKYSNVTYLKTFDIINKYNIIKNSDIFFIDKIYFEIFVKKDSSEIRFSYKIYFIIYLLSNTFSFINYKLIPGTNRNVSFFVKLEGLLTNKAQIETFITQFILEKKHILNFKTITQKISCQNEYIYLNLSFPLKEYTQLNFLKLQNLSFLNLEQEILFLKFRLSKKKINIFFSNQPITKYSHYFSFWKILIKQK